MEVHTDQIAEAWIEATVIRADGTVEELGVLDSYKRPWWRSLLRKVCPWRR
jgi:hypothetical protein